MGGKGSKGTKGNRGGRPRKSVSEAQVEKLVKAFQRKAKEAGKDFADLLADWAYNDKTHPVRYMTKRGQMDTIEKPEIDIKDRIRCVEIYANYTITKRTENVVETKNVNVVEIPTRSEDPAKQGIEEKQAAMLGQEFLQ